MNHELPGFRIQRQPDDTTCGPTCLHAVYRYFGEDVPLGELLAQVPSLEGGGTLGVLLATHAVRRGYRARVITWNIDVFDPTWFEPGAPPLVDKLRARIKARRAPKLRVAARAYVDFLEAGGAVEFRDLNPGLLRKYLKRGVPVLTGLSATFLYREPREIADENRPDDVAGDPSGHFVVLTGYRAAEREVLVSDPLYPNPLAAEHTYPVDMDRLIGAIYLGVLTYDANLVVIEPRKPAKEAARA